MSVDQRVHDALKGELANAIEKLMAERVRNQELLARVVVLEGAHRSPGGAALFRKRARPYDNHLAKIKDDPSDGYWILEWSVEARRSGLGRGNVTILDGRNIAALPGHAYAQNWWHLCAKLGIEEGVARVFYLHPEDGQEGAVADAAPVQRTTVYCDSGES